MYIKHCCTVNCVVSVLSSYKGSFMLEQSLQLKMMFVLSHGGDLTLKITPKIGQDFLTIYVRASTLYSCIADETIMYTLFANKALIHGGMESGGCRSIARIISRKLRSYTSSYVCYAA